MAEHMELEPLELRMDVRAVAVRLINLGWFRVGDERYARKFRTFGITTLRKSHVRVRGSRVAFRFRAQAPRARAHGARRLRARRRDEGAARGARRAAASSATATTTSSSTSARARLNDYIREHMGEDFTAKDFRTWGGTLLAAVALAERGPAETRDGAEARRRDGHAHGRRAARKHAGSCARFVRQPGGRRAVSRRANDR